MNNPNTFSPKNFLWSFKDGIATITLNRPERKNPLTFDSYAELRDTFESLKNQPGVRAVVLTGAGENFCSGGDVHEIIGPLVSMDSDGLLEFTTMTGDLVIAMMSCPQVIVAAIDGVCVGAGAILAMASDIRFGTDRVKIAFLFVRVGLAGCDMGACSILPRIIGQGRAAELLYTGRSMRSEEALQVGFLNRVCKPGELLKEATSFAQSIACGPTKAHAVTKKMLVREWDLGVYEAIREEAVAQAKCMETNDFRRAYLAFVNKQVPKFEGD